MAITSKLPAPNVMREQFTLCLSLIFDQVQTSLSNHRKNFVALNKVHLEAAEYTEETLRGTKIIGETQFQKVFSSFLLRVLPVKKGVLMADRALKFVGGYIRFMNERAIDVDVDAEDADDETPASRFTAYLLDFLLGGFAAKDKTIRYRVLYTMQEMITHLGAIDEDSYIRLRSALLDRITDKEPSVRSLAATCLSKLAMSEDPSDYNEGNSIMDTLIDVMAYDTSPEVRRAVIMNIPVNERSVPAVLERTMDVDQPTRKLVFGQILNNNVIEKDDGEERMGPTHPQTFTIAQRELILKVGLGDRDVTVRKATELLIGTWMDAVSGKAGQNDVKIEEQTEEQLETAPLALLELFDLNSDLTLVTSALLSIFTTRPTIFKKATFSANYWQPLTPEKAFFARVYLDHCRETKDEVRLEAFPVVLFIATRIQHEFNAFIDFLAAHNDLKSSHNLKIDEFTRSEDERISRLFVISELLELAVNLDYADESGRRKTFELVRNMLGSEILPEVLMAPCLDVLRVLSTSERDLIRLVVEIVAELRDTILGDFDEIQAAAAADASFDESAPPPAPRLSIEDLTPEQKVRLDTIDLKCLRMCIGMLERVNSTFEENITLDGVLRSLIIPSTRREGLFLEQGTKALGLCCLIARKLAIQNFKNFMASLTSAPPNIRLILVQSLIDIFMVHESIIFNDKSNNLEMVTQFLMMQIVKEREPKVQAAICQGMAKLVISGIITEVEVIKTLLKMYISPSTAGNEELRQCLILFFKIFSHSSTPNQQRMRQIFILIFLDVCEDRKNAIEADECVEIIESGQLASMFLDWTDPIHLSNALAARNVQDGLVADECIQLDMAKDIITLLFEKNLKVQIEKEDMRVLCQLLNKLHVPDIADVYRVRSLKVLMMNLRTRRPLRDTVCKTALTKFEATITKKFETQLEGFTEEEFRQLEELQDLFSFLDSIIPEDDDELTEIDAPRTRGRKRRSESIISTTTGSRSSSAGPRKGKGKAKRLRLSTGDDDDEDDNAITESTPQPEAPPTRTVPKRAATSRKPDPREVIVISSDSEEYEETSARTRNQTGTRFRPAIKEEDQLERDLHDILNISSASTSEIPFDSIMDSDPDSEDEVNGLLAEE